MRPAALALTAWLLVPAALPAAAAGDEERQETQVGPAAEVLAWRETSGYARTDPEFALTVAFGDEAMGGVGQCGNPSERGLRRCKLRLAESGPAVVDSGTPATAVGVRLSWRF